MLSNIHGSKNARVDSSARCASRVAALPAKITGAVFLKGADRNITGLVFFCVVFKKNLDTTRYCPFKNEN